jgi:hypothetical protein
LPVKQNLSRVWRHKKPGYGIEQPGFSQRDQTLIAAASDVTWRSRQPRLPTFESTRERNACSLQDAKLRMSFYTCGTAPFDSLKGTIVRRPGCLSKQKGKKSLRKDAILPIPVAPGASPAPSRRTTWTPRLFLSSSSLFCWSSVVDGTGGDVGTNPASD